ncbi:hypothetical protein H8R18_04855 [Nanchangia anserum]|uniref:Uncharacterized protein n=1 Tax=Nanchangia anserum TaxID=2692125 RepID=A0A8I0KN43_9ACTO|nr:DUF6308 family protein [Nanchangia anserum]MBD3688881.1 hypothetical protein [Nanchangia anserum]QOX81148.1 hypothetical protein H8R18_04855 [Nanchangia anserum]
MTLTLPPLITGIIHGDEHAWLRACTMLGAYYRPEGGHRSAFDLIRSGDPYADDGLLSGCDLAALSAVGVRLSPRRARRVLDDPEIHRLIAALPRERDIVDADDDVIGDSSAAAQLFHRLADDADLGLGWKGAQAVLARVRPALFPLVTGPERKALGVSKNMPALWRQLRDRLRDDDARLAYQLYYLVQTAPVWSELSQIQVLMALVHLEAEEAKQQRSTARTAADTHLASQRREAKRARALAAESARTSRHRRDASGRHAGEPISTSAVRLRDHR